MPRELSTRRLPPVRLSGPPLTTVSVGCNRFCQPRKFLRGTGVISQVAVVICLRESHDALSLGRVEQCRNLDHFTVRDAMTSLHGRRAGQDRVATKAAVGTSDPRERKEGASMEIGNRPPDGPDRLVFNPSLPAFGAAGPGMTPRLTSLPRFYRQCTAWPERIRAEGFSDVGV